jgi:2-succinyl-5-enolpyruvyl-6-hydroxy-3-cyclohexene-1-carboxylate synthase
MSGVRSNEVWARVLVDELVRTGVREVLVAPGSRSTPLVMAVAARSELRVVVQIDERSAAFMALGVGKATGRPAVVITTSGTAVANLLPAVVEASLSETPLLLITADRPPRLRGSDANQAVDQERIFGRYPSFYRELSPAELSDRTLRHLRSVVAQAVAAARGGMGGAAHLNLPFEKPLEPVHPAARDTSGGVGGPPGLGLEGRPGGRPFTRIHPGRCRVGDGVVEGITLRISRARRPLVVAGALPRSWEVGGALRRFSARFQIPLLADPLSGARFPSELADPPVSSGPEGSDGGADPDRTTPVVVGGYDLALGDPALRHRLAPDLILRVGRSPTSSALLDWFLALSTGHDPPWHLVLDPGGAQKDHLAVADEVIPADAGALLDTLTHQDTKADESPGDSLRWQEGWVKAWRALDVSARQALEDWFSEGSGMEGEVPFRILPHLRSEDLLFVSSSMPIRDVNTFVLSGAEPRGILGNRGASGIDGIVSTAAGASLGSGRRVVALVGDLALLHDSAGLAVLREKGVRLLVVVVNNDGGGIFHHLPIREFEPEFTPLFATPHGRDLSHLADFQGLPFRRVDLRGGAGEDASKRGDSFDQALQWLFGLPRSGILELRTDRDEAMRLRHEAVEHVQTALRTRLLNDAHTRDN